MICAWISCFLQNEERQNSAIDNSLTTLRHHCPVNSDDSNDLLGTCEIIHVRHLTSLRDLYIITVIPSASFIYEILVTLCMFAGLISK
jgi:hypothetical protein